MKAEYINPLLRACTELLEAELGERTTRGTPSLITEPTSGFEVCTVVAFSGSPHGLVVLGLSSEHADVLVERLLKVSRDDVEIAGSLLVELTQLIVESAIAQFPDNPAKCNVTPAALFLNPDARLSFQRLPRISVPLSTAGIDMVLQVSLIQ